jgi:hypothetical protein
MVAVVAMDLKRTLQVIILVKLLLLWENKRVVYKTWKKINVIGENIPTARCFNSVNVWKDSAFVFGGSGAEALNDFYELVYKESSSASDSLSQMAEGPFYRMLSCLDINSLCKLGCTSSLLRQRRYSKLYF